MTWKTEVATTIGKIAMIDSVAGGDINDAYRVQLIDGRSVFVKTHRDPPAGMYEAEAAGLEWLRGGSLVVPRVVAVAPAWLALEWLDLDPRRPDLGQLGRGLAELHRRGSSGFGLDRANYLATIAQDNTVEPDWPTFYVERRLRPLIALGAKRGRLPDLHRDLDRLRARVDRFGPPEPPSRLHGDLWWGNVASLGGRPAIIDPAVYGGHRETDLAMLDLFGGLPDRLIDAYNEAFPLAPGWRERIALHQLYPVGAHAVLFGGGYGAQFSRMLTAVV